MPGTDNKINEERFRIDRKIISILTIFSLVGFCLVIIVLVSVNTFSALRGFSNLQNYPNLAHKDAAYNLTQYVNTGEQVFFDRFKEAVAVIQSTGELRTELLSSNPSHELIRSLLLSLNTQPRDVSMMITTFNRFKSIGHFAEAIQNWHEANEVSRNMYKHALEIQEQINTVNLTSEEIALHTTKIAKLDEEQRALNDQIAYNLSNGTMLLNHVATWASVSLGLILLITGLFFFTRFSSSLRTWQHKLEKNELEQRKLITELTQSNKDLQQFTYITSHNLRAPLSNLASLLDLLEDITIEDEDLKELLNGFKSSTQLLNNTIEDLTGILTIKENTSVERKEILFQNSFEDVLHQTRNLIIKENPAIVYDFSEAPLITFNKSYLESIFLNLLTNALKYRDPARELKVTVTSKNTGNTIYLLFQDNGLGIDVDQNRDKLFGLYQRFHNHSESKGLGLFLVKTQLESLGGSIDIKSTVGKGTTFILSFLNSEDDR